MVISGTALKIGGVGKDKIGMLLIDTRTEFSASGYIGLGWATAQAEDAGVDITVQMQSPIEILGEQRPDTGKKAEPERAIAPRRRWFDAVQSNRM